VTLYGQADAAFSSVKSGANKLTGVLGAGRGSNFVGFMGSEDLGGGWKANFKLEAGYNLDNGTGAASNTNNQPNGGFTTQSGGSTTATINSATGAAATQDRASMGGAQGLTFNRWSYAGLSNANVGEIRIGREYTPTFQAVLGADMTGANGVQNTLFQTLYLGQANSHATATSASNGISYESPRFSGFGVKAQMFYGENTSPVANANLMTGKSGDGTSYHASYVNGPISAGFGAQSTKGTNIAASNGVGQIPGKYDVSTGYAKYDFGVATAAVAQVTEKMALSTGANENKSTVLGLRVPMGATTLNATYTTSKLTVAGAASGKATQLGLQALYAMSKRTDLYVNYAVTDNGTEGTGTVYGIGNGSGRVVAVGSAGAKSTAYQVGVRHNF
jgi:predicted porin